MARDQTTIQFIAISIFLSLVPSVSFAQSNCPPLKKINCAVTSACVKKTDSRQCGRDAACEAAKNSQNALYEGEWRYCIVQRKTAKENCELANSAMAYARLLCVNSGGGISVAPYTPIEIAVARPYEDQTLKVFRTEVAAAARRRSKELLKPLVDEREFFWLDQSEMDLGGGTFGVEALVAAFSLDPNDETAWKALEDLAENNTAEPLVGDPKTLCSPAGPQYDLAAFRKLLDATGTDKGDWVYTLLNNAVVRVSPELNAKTIDKLQDKRLVRAIFESLQLGGIENDFTPILLPRGGVGFVRTYDITALGGDQLCFRKDGFGKWKIVGKRWG
jgi:hypothetical protein